MHAADPRHEGGEAMLRAVMERLSGLPGMLRQQLNDHLWQAIAADNYEFIYVPAAVAATPYNVQAKTEVIFRVESIVASVPANQTASIVLGDVTIPVPAGVTSLPGLRLQLNRSDTRSITPSGNGAVLLLLTGEQLSPWAQMTR
jgi:hypothetical protein